MRACNNCNFDNLSEFVTKKQICQDDGTDLFRALEQQEPKQPGRFMTKIFWRYENKSTNSQIRCVTKNIRPFEGKKMQQMFIFFPGGLCLPGGRARILQPRQHDGQRDQQQQRQQQQRQRPPPARLRGGGHGSSSRRQPSQEDHQVRINKVKWRENPIFLLFSHLSTFFNMVQH